MWRVLLMWIATEFYNCVLILPVVLAAPRGWFWRWQNPFRFSSWKYVLPLGSLVPAEVFSIVFHGPGAIAFVIPSFLTGALARRALMEHGQKLLNRLQQDKRSVAVLMMDLDHFKQINDRFGHAQGDVVLQKFVELAHGALRPEDLLGRMGGEEFAMVLPGVDAQQAGQGDWPAHRQPDARACVCGGGRAGAACEHQHWRVRRLWAAAPHFGVGSAAQLRR